jgi:hypothetical protein
VGGGERRSRGEPDDTQGTGDDDMDEMTKDEAAGWAKHKTGVMPCRDCGRVCFTADLGDGRCETCGDARTAASDARATLLRAAQIYTGALGSALEAGAESHLAACATHYASALDVVAGLAS